MKIATYNANSIRLRVPMLLSWLERHRPDVLAIQETKVDDPLFPQEPFIEAGYHVAFHGQKAYSGVAILSLEKPQNVRTGLEHPDFPEDRRLIRAELNGLTLINTYVPNGTLVGSEKFAYKLRWLERFRQYCDQTLNVGKPSIWLGDVNIAPKPEDVYESPRMLGGVGHHPEEFAALEKITKWGWEDLFRKHTLDGGHYTFWEYMIPNGFKRNLGWRIDHIYAPADLAARCISCTIDKEPRALEKPSDHTFVIACFDL